jgi:hypothetical protein
MLAHPNRQIHESKDAPYLPAASEWVEAYESFKLENRAKIQESLRTPTPHTHNKSASSEMDDFASDLGSFIQDLDQSMEASGAQPHVSGEAFDPKKIQDVLQMEMEAREGQHRKAA